MTDVKQPEIAETDARVLEDALDSQRDILAEIPPPEILATPGLDPLHACSIVHAKLDRIAEQRGPVAAALGEERAAVLDHLPDVVHAAMQANIEVAASDATTDLAEVHADLAEEHSLLLTDAEGLTKRKLLDPDRVDQGRPVLGYRTLVTSTLVLVALMRERFDAISHKTPTTLADLDRIGGKAKRMLRQLDMREQGEVRMLALELRARAMTHLIRTYSQVRRNITYVRWDEGDAEAIAPSLWSGRRSGKSRNEIEIPVVPVGPQPGTEPGGPFAPDAPIVPAGPIGPAPSDGDGPFTS